MAFNSVSDLNLYALGSLQFTTTVEYIQPEGTRVQLRQPTWRWVQTTGNVLGNNVTITHETVDDLSGNVTITFDDYNAATMNTNIVNTAGNVSISGLNNAEDWTGATMYLDVPDDYYGNIEFTSTARNNVSNVQLQWTTVVEWTNEPELDTPATFYYNYNNQYSNQWSIDYWFYNDSTAPTSGSITSFPVTMYKNQTGIFFRGEDESGYTVTANNWTDVLTYYGQDYYYPGFDQIVFDFRNPSTARWDGANNDKLYLIVNNGPDITGADTGINYRIVSDTNDDTTGTTTDDYYQVYRAVGPGSVLLPRGQWTHWLLSFKPSLLGSDSLGTCKEYRDGNFVGSFSTRFQPGNWLTLGRNAITDLEYLEAYLEDFRVRNRTYNEYYTTAVTGTNSFTPPTTTTQASEGDWILLNTPDVAVLTFDDNNYTDRDAVTITQSGITAYSTTEVKTTASVPFDGDNYVFVGDLQPNTYDSIQLMGNAYVAFVRDDENSGTYSLNANTGIANLKLQVSSSLDGVSLTSLTGNETNNITLTGTREDINATLRTMYFIRQGDVSVTDRVGNITWTLTPPGGRDTTQITQTYRPLYVTGLTGEDRVYMNNSTGQSQLYTISYVGVDSSANPVFNYLVYDDYMYDGTLTSTTLKTEYLTGNLSYGGVEIIEVPDLMNTNPGTLSLVGPRQHINLGNTVNDNTDVVFVANGLGSQTGNVYVGNITYDCNQLSVSDYQVNTVVDTSGDTSGDDFVYIAQIPTGVANTWAEGPWSYQKNTNIVETYSQYNYLAPSLGNRQDETATVTIANSNKLVGSYTSPQTVTTFQNLDSASTASGGKKKLLTAVKTHTFDGVGQDQVDLVLQGQLALRVEDDSDANTEYITNITSVPSGGYYYFNETANNHYLSIKNDRFYKEAIPPITFSGNSVNYGPLYIEPSNNFNIEIKATMNSAVLGQRLILTNSPDESFGTTEFALVQRGTGTGPQEFRLFIGGSFISTSASYSTGTQYKLNIIRVGSTITLYVDDVAVGSTVTYTGAIGTASATTWWHTEYSTGTPRTFDGTIEDLYVDVAGSYVLFWDITTSTYELYVDDDIEFAFRFIPLDTGQDQYVLSNMPDPTATLTAGDWRLTLVDGLHGPGVSPGFKLESFTGSNTGSISMTYGSWYDITVKRVSGTWEVYIGASLDLDFGDSNAIGALDQTTVYFGNYTNSTDYFKAYLDSFSATDETGLITSSTFDSLGYESKLGTPVTLSRTSFGGDAIAGFALVYGGSDDRAYLIYTRATYTDVSENFVNYTANNSRGLFYRRLTIADDLTITVGSEVEIVSEASGDVFGWMLAADAIKLGSNMFINIVVSDADTANQNAHVYSLKFAYS